MNTQKMLTKVTSRPNRATGRPTTVQARKLTVSPPVTIASFCMIVALVAELIGIVIPPHMEARGMIIISDLLKERGNSISFRRTMARPATIAQLARSDMKADRIQVVAAKAKSSFLESRPNFSIKNTMSLLGKSLL